MFEINGVVKEIKNSSEYFKYQLKDGEKIKLSKGGSIGTILNIDGEENRPALYFRLSGLSTGVQPVTAGVSFNAGQIHATDRNLSEFLLLVLNIVE